MSVHVNLIDRKNLSGEIYRQLREAIADGRLRPGDLLPATRELAVSLNVSRMTVTVAYDRLAGEGFVTARVGSGTRVSKNVGPPGGEKYQRRVGRALRHQPIWNSIPISTAFAHPAQFEFRTGLPDPALFPHEFWHRLISGELRQAQAGAAVYGHPAGQRELCECIARHISVARGVRATAAGVTITNGAQQALDVVARTLLKSGDRVAVEDPGYLPARLLFQSLGMRVRGVPIDQEGIVVDALPRDTRLIYVTPSHQYPLGVTMSLPRRVALLQWATRNNVAIIEDDYDSEFRFEERPIEALQSLDTTGRVVYVGSFSKSLLPGLRLGFVVTPPSCTLAVRKAKFVTDWHTSTLAQAVLARFIDSGRFARHVRKLNRVYRERRDLLITILHRDFAADLRLIPSVAGLHLSAESSASVKAIATIARCASDRGVQIQMLSQFSVDTPPRAGLLFGYGAIPTVDIGEGLGRLRRCFARR